MQIRGDKIFQGGPNNSEILVLGSKNFSKIEIYYPEGPNISIYLDWVELNNGGPLFT